MTIKRRHIKMARAAWRIIDRHHFYLDRWTAAWNKVGKWHLSAKRNAKCLHF